MCGLTGFWDFKTHSNFHQQKNIIQKMTETMRARGPDDEGIWVDSEQGLAFGHRRLKIIDLSPLGHQPMESGSGEHILIFNGEIYNFQDLREDLIQKGIRFKGNSDTEILLESCELYGVEETVQKCVGMFAFALWNKSKKKLYLCRDRLGVKPLYWGIHGGVLFFGSQLSSFYPHPAFDPQINMEALGLYFKYNYVPHPHSIFQHIQKLCPGNILIIDSQQNIEEKIYWSLEKAIQQGLDNPYIGTFEEALMDAEGLLESAITKRMISDVPLGCFLSGGIDSSTVAALMQKSSSHPIKTFSIGFEERSYNEAPFAKAIADHLGTDHTETYFSSKDCLSMIPDAHLWFDEPFADASQLPMCLVSKMARQKVTVALSGDGGDEIFGGYNRYRAAIYLDHLSVLPPFLRCAAKKILSSVPKNFWDTIEKSKVFHLAQLAEKSHKIEKLLDVYTKEELYDGLASLQGNPSSFLLSPFEIPSLKNLEITDPVLYMQAQDILSYLPDDILTKVDRSSMAVGLESREPLLDHRLVEFSFRLPRSFKIHQGVSKRILRSVVGKYIPSHLLDRPKQGFAIPIDQWLKSDLSDWVESLLDPKILEKQGILNAHHVYDTWLKFKEGKENPHRIWGLMMFQSWYNHLKS